MELWCAIPKYEGSYEVSSNGAVRSITRKVPYGRYYGMTYKGKFIKPFKSKNGYPCVKLSYAGVTKTEYIHELVLRSFVGVRPHTVLRGEIRHLDGDKCNNTLENLVYGTIKENAEDRKRHRKS